jgi:NOL1/NOP2/sun family putative RNA methylase
MEMQALERYRSIVDAPRAFLECSAEPLPICVWGHPQRTTPERLLEWMTVGAEGFTPEPIGWYPAAFRLPTHVGPGNRAEFVAGLYHVQEEVSLLPPVLLDPQPGERILDLCAAPGNKTAQIALAVGATGTVVANDRHYSRLAILRRNIDRLGLTNCVTTLFDAASYPKTSGLFDRVLADVPCSCEGTSRKFPTAGTGESELEPGRLASLQRAILRKAVQLTRPGGRIVYSTCTYAPEENEAVVAEILRELPGALRVVPAAIPGFRTAPGITRWEGESYPAELERALRIWPHHNDTGGFFAAVLEKTAATGGEPEEATATVEPIADPEPWFERLEERHGLGRHLLEGYTLFQPNRKFLSLANTSLRLPHRPEPVGIGIPLLRIDMKDPKLASGATLLFGREATRNVVQITADQADAYARREPFEATAHQLTHCPQGGHILLRYQEAPLGIGRLRRTEDGAGTVESLFPKAWAIGAGRSLFDWA